MEGLSRSTPGDSQAPSLHLLGPMHERRTKILRILGCTCHVEKRSLKNPVTIRAKRYDVAEAHSQVQLQNPKNVYMESHLNPKTSWKILFINSCTVPVCITPKNLKSIRMNSDPTSNHLSMDPRNPKFLGPQQNLCFR